ncbi:hypothetical protein AVEN_79529-1 [Araneus ventricosus]|uniref:Reverse transcriptase domain-containing protein n=1 Tax=Araneus ventricosus TaxID=182803 RepID=A0A4Y2NC97_ARAVE|nr:hypothetical protein AVEN_79529-1 [Araneus ventricosus]
MTSWNPISDRWKLWVLRLINVRLYPMVEPCFPEEFLRAWNRCPSSSSSIDAKERLTNLMNIFRTKVGGEERINLAMAGFGLNEKNRIFLEWLHEGIIEEVPVNEINLSGNYLPHRSVLNESSSTPIRPVFDASARMKGHPSLNESLHSDSHLNEQISDILLRFREKKIGVTADIRKAFLQISICKEDRDFLRFLCWKNKDCQEHKVFRHPRVVFGVRSSPFLLKAVLKYHLAKNCDVDPL